MVNEKDNSVIRITKLRADKYLLSIESEQISTTIELSGSCLLKIKRAITANELKILDR